MYDIIDKALQTKDGQIGILNYFKQFYPEKRFSLCKIAKTYYDMVDDNHHKNLTKLIKEINNAIH